MENNIIKLTKDNDIGGVRRAIEEGADINLRTKSEGWTGLMKASQMGYAEIAELLIKKGADVNIKDEYGWTALDYAKRLGNQRIVELLTNLKPIIVPTSKVIQINTNEKGGNLIQTALCEDGSVWIYANKKWTSILNNSTN